MSSTLFVPFDFYCQSHKDNEIQFVDMAPGKKNRLFCSECNNKPDTLQSIDSVFKFLTDVQTKYTNIQQDFERCNRSLSEIKKKFNQYIDDFAQKIKEWEASIESNKLIEESFLKKILQRTYQYSTQQLYEFLEGITNKIDIKNQQITLKKHYFSKEDKNFKDKITKKIQELTAFLNNQEVINYEIEQNISGPYSKQTELAFPNEINVMEFNKDGTLLAVGNQIKVDDCFFSIWAIDAKNQLSLVQRLKNHTKTLKCICFSSQNNQILTGSSDATAILWKQLVLREWICAVKFQNTISINCLKFNHSSDQIAIGAGQLKVWKNDAKETWNTFQQIEDHKNQVYSIDFNQDDSLLVSADHRKQIVVSQYQSNQWTTLFLLGCATQPVFYLEFLTLKDFMSVSNNNEMIFWIFSESIDDYECKIQKLDYQVTQTSYSKISNTLALQNKKNVQLFNIVKYDLISILGIEVISSSLQCSKDGSKIALFAENKLQIYTKKK